MDSLAAILEAAVILNLVSAASIILFECDSPVLVYLSFDLELADLILSLSLDFVSFDLEFLECHGDLAAVMLYVVAPPDAALLALRLLRGDRGQDVMDIDGRAEAAVPTLRVTNMGEVR